VKTAVRNLLKEGGIGLVLTGLMILLFLGSPRATFAVLLSIPLSALTCFLVMNGLGGSINTMLLGGLALAFSRLIDDSVVCWKTSSGSWKTGLPRAKRREKGGMEVALAVLAATSTTSIVFFPVTFFYGVSRYLFIDLALGRSRVHLRVIRLCDDGCTPVLRVLHPAGHLRRRGPRKSKGCWCGVVHRFNHDFQRLLLFYEPKVMQALETPGRTALFIVGGIVLLIAAFFPFVGRAYFPRTDPGQLRD